VNALQLREVARDALEREAVREPETPERRMLVRLRGTLRSPLPLSLPSDQLDMPNEALPTTWRPKRL
jgi:hypothetical protein